jgi:microcystin-dependent protein
MEGYLAQIIMFAGDFAPRFWAFCQGQLLPIQQNTALFSLLGTTYGGNGTTTFALPNMIGRSPVGISQGPGLSNVVLGEQSGSNTVTLLSNNLPAHTHTSTLTVAATSNAATTDEAGGAIPAGGTALFAPGATAAGAMGGVTVTVANAGGGQPISIRQPYIGMHFVICLSGIFPSRN